MDEQRVQAYLSLIQELLDCPSGANDVLNGHLELVDEGFVQVCQLVAAQLQSDGQENGAGFLRNLAQRVRKYLNSQAHPTSNQYLAILVEILNAEIESHSDPKVVYPILEKHQDQLDLNFAETLTQWFQAELDPNNSQRNQDLASLLNNFAINIQQFPLGSRADNLEIAIASYEAALEVYTRTAFPEYWAGTQNNLATAYLYRIRGERAENLERAIASYQAALEVYTRTAFPENWATTQNNLATAYGNRIRGERAENLELAIKYYEAALEVYTRTAFPENWAMTQNNLATAYGNRIRGERAENLELAIASYEAALEVRTRTAFSQDWATTQNNLATAYSDRIRGERAENLELAIKYYEAALEVRTRTAFPENWAMTQNNLAIAYGDRIRGERAENLERAIAFSEAALEVYTRTAFPENWAMTQNNLANAYSDRIRGERAENLEQAIKYYEAALEVRTRTAFPEKWAMTQHNLALAYSDRIRGERAENLELAIASYEAALEVYTRTVYPQDWATIQNNLATAYGNRIRGERAENLELAIASYEAALEVYTPAAFPQDWAMTQNNLALAYSDRIRGERAENLERAIAFSEAALKVYTRTAFPENWAGTQNNLAIAYGDHIRGERAENLERAIKYYEAALKVYTRTAFPENWAMTQNNLATAYSDRIRGERAENLERAIAFSEAALEVYTRTAFPEKWATTQHNLANAYRNRIRGERAENLEQAIKYYQAALEVRTRTAFPQDWAMTQNNLANAYGDHIRGERAENLERAIKYYEAALEVYTPAAFPEKWAMTQNNLANAYSDRIRGERAENLERAIEFYQSALEVRTRNAFPQNHTETLNNLGLTYQNQSRYYTSDPEKKQTALQNAYNAFEQALDTVEFLRGEITSGDEAKRKLNEEYNRIYRGIVEVCLELGNYTAAIEYVDRSKARNLVELIATRDAYPQGVIPPEISQRLQHLRNAIAEEDRRLKQDPNPDKTHINQMREERQQLEPYKPLHFKQIQALLDEETAILEWYILPDKFLTFTLTAQTLNLWTSSEEDLDKLIDWTTQYRNAYYQAKEALQVAIKALKAAKTEQEQQKAQELLIRAQAQAQDIWQNPLAQRLETLAEILHLPEILQNLSKKFPNCKKLILIPHRYLHLFPLHALPIPTGESEVKSLQELFEQGVTYAPNCQLLQQAQTRHRPNFKRLFAVQNPTKDLSYADLQVETIRRLFPDRRSLQKHNATKANFLAKDLRQTHHLFFSCHAGFNLDSPLDSGLQLADDILTLGEIIASLNLSQCSLVTLSACETGQVALDATDEYISLSSGFILAGSPSVLVSLWSVDEVSTALLLIKTYETLQNHPGQLAIALKTAQIWLRDTTVKGFQDWVEKCQLLVGGDWQERLAEFFRKLGQNEKGVNDRPYQSPYHWAAFCVVGQGEQKMASDSDKIQAFTHLLSHNLLADYLPDLEELKPQLGDDDEKNAEAIEQWLNTDQRKSILTAYQEQLKSITSINPLLGVTGEKGIGGSKPNHKTPNLSLKELIENTTKDNTNLHKNPEEKPPQS